MVDPDSAFWVNADPDPVPDPVQGFDDQNTVKFASSLTSGLWSQHFKSMRIRIQDFDDQKVVKFEFSLISGLWIRIGFNADPEPAF